MVVWELFSRSRPYADKSLPEVFQYVAIERRVLPRPSAIPLPDSIWVLMLECWSWHPADRPDFARISRALRKALSMVDAEEPAASASEYANIPGLSASRPH